MIVSNTEVANFLGAASSAEETALRGTVTAAAEQAVRDYLGRKRIEQSTGITEVRTGLRGRDVWLRTTPCDQVTCASQAESNVPVTVIDGAAGHVRIASGMWQEDEAYTFTYRGGFTAAKMPKPIQLATLHVIAREVARLRDKGRFSRQSEAESTEAGSSSGRVQFDLDGSTRLLLDPYRRL